MPHLPHAALSRRLPSIFNYQMRAHAFMEGPAHVWHFAKTIGTPEAERLRRMRAHVAGRGRSS
jgi:hypothetical protein